MNCIESPDYWCLGELYSVLTSFADEPSQAIRRIGGGRFHVPEDQANHLDHYYKMLLTKYPELQDLEVMRVVAKIDAMLTRMSAGGETFDSWFWTNHGFEHHDVWNDIRELARAFLLR